MRGAKNTMPISQNVLQVSIKMALVKSHNVCDQVTININSHQE